MCLCRAPGKSREVKIVGAKRNLVVFLLLSLGVFLLYRTSALLTLAIAIIIGALPPPAGSLRVLGMLVYTLSSHN
jgi:hypothetical protein